MQRDDFLWVEKYRPKTISECILPSDLEETFSGQGSNKYAQQFDGNRKFSTFPNWPKDLYQNSEYVSLFPNVMIGIHVDHFYAFWLEPLSINKTREHIFEKAF